MGFIGSSSVAGAGRPRRGGGSAYGISAGCIGSGADGSMNRSTITSFITSTGRSTMTSLMTSIGTSLTTSRSTITSLGGF